MRDTYSTGVVVRDALLTGFVVWLLATLAVRLAGHWLFRHDQPLALLLAFAVVAAALAWLVAAIFRRQRLESPERLTAAVGLALPGMLLDAICVALFPAVFPNMPPAAQAPFAAWLLWAYGVVLATGLVLAGPAQLPQLPRLLGIGLAIGVGGTLLYRAAGQLFFVDTPAALAANGLLAAAIAAGLTYPIYRRHGLAGPLRAGGVIALLLPIIAINVVSTLAYPTIYPNLPPSLHGLYGAWCLWAYGLALLTALAPRPAAPVAAQVAR